MKGFVPRKQSLSCSLFKRLKKSFVFIYFPYLWIGNLQINNIFPPPECKKRNARFLSVETTHPTSVLSVNKDCVIIVWNGGTVPVHSVEILFNERRGIAARSFLSPMLMIRRKLNTWIILLTTQEGIMRGDDAPICFFSTKEQDSAFHPFFFSFHYAASVSWY